MFSFMQEKERERERKREKERERERERGGDSLYQLATFEQRQLFLTLEQSQSKNY